MILITYFTKSLFILFVLICLSPKVMCTIDNFSVHLYDLYFLSLYQLLTGTERVFIWTLSTLSLVTFTSIFFLTSFDFVFLFFFLLCVCLCEVLSCKFLTPYYSFPDCVYFNLKVFFFFRLSHLFYKLFYFRFLKRVYYFIQFGVQVLRFSWGF